MDRRLIVFGLAAGAVGPALAQTGGSAVPMGGGNAPAGGVPLGNAEVEHGKRTAIGGAATLEMSRAGLVKASNPKVKEFAQFEHDEQTTIASVLKMMDPSLGTAKPEARMADMIQRLNGLSGAEFDKAFLAGQVEGHQALLAIQEDYISGGRNREHRGIAMLARGQIREHLAVLADLQKMA